MVCLYSSTTQVCHLHLIYAMQYWVKGILLTSVRRNRWKSSGSRRRWWKWWDDRTCKKMNWFDVAKTRHAKIRRTCSWEVAFFASDSQFLLITTWSLEKATFYTSVYDLIAAHEYWRTYRTLEIKLTTELERLKTWCFDHWFFKEENNHIRLTKLGRK